MCTVSYLPLAQGFILTHNRDEAPMRSPQAISREKHAGTTLLFPKDTRAGGAWIAAARDGRTACLLNGAFEKHKHQPPYRRSRGLVLLDFFEWPEPDDFFAHYDLNDIEPFTFLFFLPNRVAEFRWDGNQRHLSNLQPNEAHFWCSSTLYPSDMQIRREQVFRKWLAAQRAQSDPPGGKWASAVFKLHLTGSVGDPENDFVMNRGGRVCTVSVTQVIWQDGRIHMRYRDLLEGQQDHRQMQLVN